MSEIGQSGLKKPATLIALGQNMSGGTPAFDPAYQAVLDYATLQGFTLPSPENQITQNALFQGQLRSAGMWDSIDAFYNFFCDSPDHNFVRINWKNPGSNQITGVAGYAPLVGLSGNGVNELDTHFVVTGPTGGVFFDAQNISGYAHSDNFCSSVYSVGSVLAYPWNGGNNVLGEYPSFTGILISNTDDANWRTASFNGVVLANNNYGFALNFTGLSMRLFSGFGFSYSTGTMRMFGMGKSQTGKDAIINNAWNDYVHTTVAVLAYKKIIDYATLQGYVLPSAEQQLDQRRLISELSRAGVWSELDIFYNFITDGDHNFAKINWKNPGTFQADGTGHEPVFGVNVGLKGDGASLYLTTQYFMNAGVKYKQDNAGYFLDLLSAEPLFGFDFGSYDGTNFTQFVGNNVGSVEAHIQSGNSMNVPAQAGLWHANFLTSRDLYLNGVYKTTGGTGLSAIVNNECFLFARAAGVNPQLFSNRRLGCFGIGASARGKEAALSSAWKLYRDKYYVPPHPYDAVIAYATAQGFTLPSAPQQTTQRQLITDLMAAGIWDLLDVFYNLLTDGDFNFAKINWIAPGVHQGISNGVVVFTPNVGVYNNAGPGNALGNIETIAPVNCVKATANGASHFFDYELRGEFGQHGVYDGINFRASLYYIDGCYFDGGAVAIPGLKGSSGFYHIDFTVANGGKISGHKNASLLISTDYFHPAPAITSKLWICQRSDLGASGINDNQNIFRCFALGGSLYGKEFALYNAWIKYANPVRAKGAYAKIIAYATAQTFALPSASQQAAGELLILELINAGVWDSLDVFYNFITDGDHNFARINWKNPGTFQLGGTAVFTPLDGFKGNGSVLTTGATPSTLPSYTLNDAGAFADISEFTGGVSRPFGACEGAAVNRLFPTYTNPLWEFDINGSDAGTQFASPSDFFMHIKRVSGTVSMFSNGTSLTSRASAANGEPAFPVFLFGLNLGGAPSNLSTARLRCFGLGASLNGKELALYTPWNKYQATVKSKPAYAAIIAYATLQGYVLPSAPQQVAGEKLIYDLMIAGAWNELDVFYNFITDGDRNFAKINWKNPGTFQMFEPGSPLTYTANMGFFSVGGPGSGYFNTGWTPSLHAVKSSLNNFWMAIGMSGIPVYADGFQGVDQPAQQIAFNLQPIAGSIDLRINMTAVTSRIADPSFNTSYGAFQLWREGSTVMKAKKDNGAELIGGTTPSVALPTLPLYLLSYSNSGVQGGLTAGRIEHWAIGSSMNPVRRNAFYDALKTYLFPYAHLIAYQRIVDYAVKQGFVLPSAPVQAKGKQLIRDLMDAGVWDQLDVFYVFRTDGDHNFAKINWKSPGLFQAVGTPVFTPLSGFNSDLTSYLDTGFNPSVHGVKYTDTSASMFGYSLVDGNFSDIMMGCANAPGSTVSLVSPRNSGNFFSCINRANGEFITVVDPNSIGLYMVSIQGSEGRSFKEGVQVGLDTTIGGVRPNQILTLLGFNSGTVGNFYTRGMSMAGAGGSLAGKELALSTAWNTYKAP